MNVFKLHKSLIRDYDSYIGSFINIRDQRISGYVKDMLSQGLLWPEPLIQLNPSFKLAKKIDELVEAGVLHHACSDIFRKNKEQGLWGDEIRLFQHQYEAIEIAKKKKKYVLTTGTG